MANHLVKARVHRAVIALALLLFANVCTARDPEPRRWTHLPVGMNVPGVGASLKGGAIHFDPVLKIDDATVGLYATGSSYVHSFAWPGESSGFDSTVPCASSHGEGLPDGEYATRRRRGHCASTARGISK